ncbi:MAG TPA: nitroreductase/quinone reductase family protein [Mycobacterium sp.]
MRTRRNPDWLLGMGAWTLEHGHRALLAITGGRFPQQLGGNQTLELHTVGRKSGRQYSTLLTAPIYAPERLVLVASKGGSSQHPDWYKNLVANPTVQITVRDATQTYRARTASKQEKAELWPAIVKAAKGYQGYQRNTDRDIPVVICEIA